MRTLLVACLLVVGSAAGAQTTEEPPAQTFLGVAAFVNPGDQVTITDKAGRAVTGKVVIIGPTSMTLALDNQAREFPAKDVASIDRRHRQAVKGLKIGLVAGAALGLIAAAASAASPSDSTVSGDDAFGALFVGAIVGGLWGSAIGALVPGHTTIYRAPPGIPAIVITPHGGAIAFTFRF